MWLDLRIAPIPATCYSVHDPFVHVWDGCGQRLDVKNIQYLEGCLFLFLFCFFFSKNKVKFLSFTEILEISPGCSLEGLMLKLKLQYFGHLRWRADTFEKTLMLGKIEGRKRRE